MKALTRVAPTPARQRTCAVEHWRARTWAEVADEGTVSRDDQRGWYILFSAVTFPGASAPQRVRFNRAPQFGRFESKLDAERCLTTIRQRAMTAPLHEILVEYMPTPPPQAMVPHRWRHQFLTAKRIDFERGEISKERFRHLRDLPNPGYLDFWANHPVGGIDGPSVRRWYEWLRAGPKT